MRKTTLALGLASLVILTGCASISSNGDEPTPVPESNNNSEVTPTVKEYKENQTVLLKTNKGDIKLELYNEDMPITAGNFVKLVEEGFYDGVIFHRIIDGFMIQGGDPDGNGTGGPGYTIEDEFTDNNENNRGTLSMANAGPNTGGSQFFINLVDNNFLDDKHPVFGKVIEGMDIIDEIAKVETDGADKPLDDVTIKNATLLK